MTSEELKLRNEEFKRSENARDIDVTMLGDKNVLVQVIMVLGMIKAALKENRKVSFNVEIGNNIKNGNFEFLVNNTKTDDLVLMDKVEIN